MIALVLLTTALASLLVLAFLEYSFYGTGLRSGPTNSQTQAGGAEYNVTLRAIGSSGSDVLVNAANPCKGDLPPGAYHYWSCVWALSWGCPEGCTGNLSTLPLKNATLIGDVGAESVQLYSTHVWSPSAIPPDGQGQSIIAVTGEAQLGAATAPTLYWWANLTIQVGA